MLSSKPQPYYKFVLIGNLSVGKTSLLKTVMGRPWNFNYECIVLNDFQVLYLDVDNKPTKIQIWDTVGQERFGCGSLTAGFYRGAQAIIIAYDVTNRASFQEIENWINDLQKKSDSNAEMIMIGNKIDLDQKREVSYDEGKQLADSLGAAFLETSAKEKVNVQEAFKVLVRNIRVKLEKNNPQGDQQEGQEDCKNPSERVQLKSDNSGERAPGSCCSVT